jgi:hypothetical protein
MGITGIQMGAGMGMVMNEREWEGMRMKIDFRSSLIYIGTAAGRV